VPQRDSGGRTGRKRRAATKTRGKLRRDAARLTVATLVALLAVPTQAIASGLPRKEFGPGIDPHATYDGQNTCSPKPKPGVLSFKRMVTRAFPATSEGYISRACSVGGQSEHKEGRAWDWPNNAYSARGRRRVGRLLDWLLKRDAYSHRYALARRFGIMYIIWNRRIWFPFNGWQAYHGTSPHTDHVHFSFTWKGARRRTTNWHRPKTFVTAAASNEIEQGYWSATGTATVLTAGGNFHGDHRDRFARGTVAGIAARSNADGYWLAKRSGAILAFGAARRLGRYKGMGTVVDIASAPQGQGFWTVTASGRVKAFGNVEHYGQSTSNARIVGIAPTPSGAGYWLATKRGRIFEFGNAGNFGDLTSTNPSLVDIEPSPTQGFWLVTRGGRVTAFGGARFDGDARAADLRSPIVALTSTPGGSGYWLIDRRGKAREYGSARSRSSTSATVPRPQIPAGGVPIPERDEGPYRRPN
jgi:hypothetical protein